MKKVYVVENSEGYGFLAVAETPGKAKATAMGNDGFDEFTELRARRRPALDALYKLTGELPDTKEMVEKYGWWQECKGCQCQVDENSKGQKWINNYSVYCAKCAKKEGVK